MQGLIQEKRAFAEEDSADDLVDVFSVGAAIKIESHEICEYESLIDKACEMKHTKVAQVLSQSLKEEKARLKKMEAFAKKVKPKEMMSEDRGPRNLSSAKFSQRKRAA